MTENGTTTTYTYDANNRLLTETKPGSVKSYTYDANGNMLTGDGATYTYDARGRQSSYVKGSTFAGYTYYPTGLRKTKTSSLAVTNYAWDGGNMVLEYNGSAAAGKVYIYGLTLISQGNSWYYIYNAHGDVVKYINASGTVLKSYDYDAFGEEASPSNTDANPFRYAGQYFDSETGTYYLRARYYNPALGRFTQRDTHWNTGNMLYGDDPLMLTQYIAKPDMLAIVQSSNLYVYCMGNPVAYVDETGESASEVLRKSWEIGILISQFDSPALGLADLVGLLFAFGGTAVAGGILVKNKIVQKQSDREDTVEKAIEEINKKYPNATIIYRKGNGNGTNLTPREKDIDGLSYTTIMPTSGKFTVTCMEIINASGILTATFDPLNMTHVLVNPTVLNTLPEWQASRSNANTNPHPYTKFLQSISVKIP